MSVPVETVFQDEFRQVENSRALRLELDYSQRPPAERSLVGLAFSGGGIRSATFNLGVLQAFARHGLLHCFDYISTVSGGGYIGGWLQAWMHHQEIGIGEVEHRLNDISASPSHASERPEIRFLRNYSNYLTPQKGLLGADFWAFLASYLRNTILNLTILVLLLLSLLFVPRAIAWLFNYLEILEVSIRNNHPNRWDNLLYAQYFAIAIGFLLGFLAVIFLGLNLVVAEPRKGERYRCYSGQAAIQWFIVVPLFLSAAFFAYGLAYVFGYGDFQLLQNPLTRLPLVGLILYGGPWLGAILIRWAVQKARKQAIDWFSDSLMILTAMVTGWIISFLFIPFAQVLAPASHPGALFNNWYLLTVGTPTFVGIMQCAGVLHTGLMGRQMSDATREWWARLGGWLFLYSLGWMFVFAIAIYFPYGLGALLTWEEAKHHYVITIGSSITWILSTTYGVLFGKSSETGKWIADAPAHKKVLAYVAKLTPYIFVLGLFMLLSLLAACISYRITNSSGPILARPLDNAFDICAVYTCVAFFVLAVLLSCRVDVNEFSVHHLYCNRLIRCYLGASVRRRNSQPFTGFSDRDDIPLASLQIPSGATDKKHGRPLPILNTSLNVVRGKELALQTRKARSFAFTPVYSGFTRPKPESIENESLFAPTKDCGSGSLRKNGGLSLGTAIAISGAAASPNMGFYSAPALGFLMTLFDVRLGWWIGNPAKEQWQRRGPIAGFYWLLCELLGATSDESPYVYLSDGGHFENLAIYELVRRRCKLIVACDASCDDCCAFSDLQNAIERCRMDFGVDLVFPGGVLANLKPKDGSKCSASHFAVGTIVYPGNPLEYGILIYLKPTLVPDQDPADVIGYVLKNSEFPHDTTANQWFDETHFENYRALGESAATAACPTIAQHIRETLS